MGMFDYFIERVLVHERRLGGFEEPDVDVAEAADPRRGGGAEHGLLHDAGGVGEVGAEGDGGVFGAHAGGQVDGDAQTEGPVLVERGEEIGEVCREREAELETEDAVEAEIPFLFGGEACAQGAGADDFDAAGRGFEKLVPGAGG